MKKRLKSLLIRKRLFGMLAFVLLILPFFHADVRAGTSETAMITVNFDVNGAPYSIRSVDIKGEKKSSGYTADIRLPVIERDGYVFGGWSYTDSNSKACYSGSVYNPYANCSATDISHDVDISISEYDYTVSLSNPEVTLKAVWYKKYTTTFDVNGGDDMSTYSPEFTAKDGVYHDDASVSYGLFEFKEAIAPNISTYSFTSYNRYGYNQPTLQTDFASLDDSESYPITFTCCPSRSGYTFLGWSETKGASSPDYPFKGTSTLKEISGKTLYAVWKKNDGENANITLNFDLGSLAGTGVLCDKDNKVVSNLLVTTAGTSLTYTLPGVGARYSDGDTYFYFYGWSVSAEAKHADYAKGDIITITEDTTLYAVWGKKFMISYFDPAVVYSQTKSTNSMNDRLVIRYAVGKPGETTHTFTLPTSMVLDTYANKSSYRNYRNYSRIIGWKKTVLAYNGFYNANTDSMDDYFVEYPLGSTITVSDSDTYLIPVTAQTLRIEYETGGAAQTPDDCIIGTETSDYYIIPDTIPVKTGYQFKCWGIYDSSSAKNKNYHYYQPGDRIYLKESMANPFCGDEGFKCIDKTNPLGISWVTRVHMLAVWEDESGKETVSDVSKKDELNYVCLSFDANGGKGGPDKMYIAATPTYASYSPNNYGRCCNDSHTYFNLPTEIPQKSGYRFLGWAKSPRFIKYSTEFKPGYAYDVDTLANKIKNSHISTSDSVSYDGSMHYDYDGAGTEFDIEDFLKFICTENDSCYIFKENKVAIFQPGTELNVASAFGGIYGDVAVFYAVWVPESTSASAELTINYDANGGTGSMSPVTKTVSSDESFSIDPDVNTFTRTGYHFVGWSTQKYTNTIQWADQETIKGSDLEKIFDTYDLDSYFADNPEVSITLYAQWERDGTGFIQYPYTSENMFKNDRSLIGGSGTVYNSNHTDAEYAHNDKTDDPGYFTAK